MFQREREGKGEGNPYALQYTFTYFYVLRTAYFIKAPGCLYAKVASLIHSRIALLDSDIQTKWNSEIPA